MRTVIAFALLTVLSGCVEESTPKEGEKAAAQIASEEDAEVLRNEQKSIEEAADAAAKLVEDETREEIEQMKAETME